MLYEKVLATILWMKPTVPRHALFIYAVYGSLGLVFNTETMMAFEATLGYFSSIFLQVNHLPTP